ncbi:UNKNOWN [Stylonychia lemnae]|uniref:Uncharacterized protein n=1 Tax=Stylonychia lemnae TaxID=5949 RepID=A0A078AFR5_STYLE|nr:UNKNOWN [Stylonychia lemnae]|eukprot:CDW81074.1 UNKNOWN [Stylonychia lemnae]
MSKYDQVTKQRLVSFQQSKQLAALNDEILINEREQLQTTSLLVIADYIRASIEILLNLNVEAQEKILYPNETMANQSMESFKSSSVLQYSRKSKSNQKNAIITMSSSKPAQIIANANKNRVQNQKEDNSFVQLLNKTIDSQHLKIEQSSLKQINDESTIHINEKKGYYLFDEHQMQKYEADIRNYISVQEQLQIYIDELKSAKEREIKEGAEREDRMRVYIEQLKKDKKRLDELVEIKDLEIIRLKDDKDLANEELKTLTKDRNHLSKQLKESQQKLKKLEEELKQLSEAQNFRRKQSTDEPNTIQQQQFKRQSSNISNKDHQTLNEQAQNVQQSMQKQSHKAGHHKNSFSVQIQNFIPPIQTLDQQDQKQQQLINITLKPQSFNTSRQILDSDFLSQPQSNFKIQQQNSANLKLIKNKDSIKNHREVSQERKRLNNKTTFLIRNYSQYINNYPQLKELIQQSKKNSPSRKGSRKNKSAEKFSQEQATIFRDYIGRGGQTQRIKRKKSLDNSHKSGAMTEYSSQNKAMGLTNSAFNTNNIMPNINAKQQHQEDDFQQRQQAELTALQSFNYNKNLDMFSNNNTSHQSKKKRSYQLEEIKEDNPNKDRASFTHNNSSESLNNLNFTNNKQRISQENLKAQIKNLRKTIKLTQNVNKNDGKQKQNNENNDIINLY